MPQSEESRRVEEEKNIRVERGKNKQKILSDGCAFFPLMQHERRNRSF